eukprot:TRINITY_DN2184_c0_g1_i1.p1 TRINITY_DN2184_c0_g1~~TRINITY_DN2184_c0_g1_i1.p1  ORF type:complete len:1777 (-),score=465.99 TRINITY_DN2184_c0_g1_i1:6-5336(-)
MVDAARQPPRLIRADAPGLAAPSEAQVERYLRLLECEHVEALKSAGFAETASAAFAAQGAGLLSGPALATAAVQALESIPSQREALREEFKEPSTLSFVLEAFWKSSGKPVSGVAAGDACTFVRFCVAFRIHCYFETSQLLHSGPAPGRPQVVFVLGGPGSGKGTQCARISKAFGFHHLSAGDLLREERKRQGSQYGELIESYIKEGKLVPVEITVKLIQQAMEKLGWSEGKFLVDGFPRSFDNMEGWEKVLGGKVDVKCALFFDCSEAMMEARILERGKTSGRADDNAEAIKKRFATFKQESMPVVEQLESQGLLRRLQAEKSVEEVWTDVRALFGPSVVFVLGGPGSGKGTVCEKIVKNCGYKHLSAGDLLREERKRPGSKIGELIESHIKEGKLVPAEITVQLLVKAMREKGWEGGKYLIDGFPRSFDNLEAWEKTVKDEVLLKFTLFMDVSEGTMEARLLERGKTSGRADDNLESIRKRFVTFRKESMPVVEKYLAEGRLRRIDAEKSPEAVWAEVEKLFGPSVVFVLGGPGAGKGTQCSRICEMFPYTHLSAGDLLREERNRPGSEYGDLINNYIKEGKLVPVEITVMLLQKAMMKYGWEGGRYLIDGFPRSFDNLQGWEKVIGSKAHVKFCLFFDCNEETMEARLLERGKTSGRADDNLESIKKRFVTFQKESLPVVEKYRSEGRLRAVNAAKPVEEVWNCVQKNFGPSVVFVLGGPGAGKGTQCARIGPAFGFQHLSAGDLLREERKRPGSELGELIESHIKEGKLVPVSIVVKLLQKAMEERGWEDGKYLIDGFPRSFENMEGWNEILGNKVDVKFCLFFDCSEKVMQERLLERGKTSGRADDNLESIKKRFATFQSESVPLAEKFSTHGQLRRINAEQSVEDVWSCVREVMQNELDTNLLNQAIVLIKPSALNKETERFVQSFLTSNKISVLKKGTTSTKELKEKNFFDKQYRQLAEYAKGLPGNFQVSAEGQERFQAKFGVALTVSELLGAESAAAKLGITAEELFQLWQNSEAVKLAPSLYVDRLTSQSGSVFVVNGFIPQWRELFVSRGEALAWFLVEFDPSQVSWQRFRADILGTTNPAKASKESIRGQLFEHWKELGLAAQPNMLDNGVHFSAGPLEALRERMLWTGATLEDDFMGRLLLTSGVPRTILESWLENSNVEDWTVGAVTRAGPVFACTEDSDTAVFRSSAVNYLRAKGESFQCWTSNARRASPTAPKAPWAIDTSGGERKKQMTILHFNDVYNVEPRVKEPVGGIARFVTKMNELKAESVARGENEAVVLFSGDAFNPSLTSTTTYGKHMVPALNAIGIHTACYGNHDFDFGVDQLEEMASQNNFPWLISNVTDKKTGLPLANGIVSRMMDYHGRKVGLIGLVEKEWLVTLATIEPDEVDYEDFCPCARRLAKQLKEQEGAEIVIALTHMRVPNDELLAHEVGEVDIILAGHDHHYEVKPVGPHGTYVLKSGTDFRDITVFQLEFTDAAPAPGKKAFEVVSHKHIEISADIKEDPEMKVFVDECMDKLGAAMDVVIGVTAVDLDCRFASIRTMETNVGNFIADVMRCGLKADIGLINSGTLRADAIIEKGEIKVRDLVNLLPMLDELCLLRMSGAQVLAVLENSVSQYPRLEGRFGQVSGVTFSFDAAKPGLQRVVDGSVMIAGEALQLDKSYTLVTKDYLRQGKDGYDVFRDTTCLADGEQAGILPTMVRDCFADIAMLNGQTDATKRSSTFKSIRTLGNVETQRVGDGPEPMKYFAINPAVEGRIVCLNPVA